MLEAVADFTEETPLTSRQREVLAVLTEQPGMTMSEAKQAAQCGDGVLKKLRALGAVRLVELADDREFRMQTKAENFPLNEEQQTAVAAVSPAIEQGLSEVFCLFGVTGSGKLWCFVN